MTIEIVRVVLIGFMASGKSTVGKELADRLGWKFIDFDDEIERRTGMTVSEIFETRGESAFREMEAELTAEMREERNIVVAPGGGWIKQPELLDSFGPETFVVWLRVSPEEAVRRERLDPDRRPLLRGPDPLATAEQLIRERRPLYSQADFAIDVDEIEPAEAARRISAELVEL